MHFRKLIVLIILLTRIAVNSNAQYGNELYCSDTEIAPADSQKLFFRLGGSIFVNNKEFFNPWQPGYTLTGFFLRPMLEYYPGPNTKLMAGVHLLKYSGLGKYHQSIPVFSLHHRFSPGMQMVAGSLYGSLNHDLIEPLFAIERVFTNYNESGLQFLISQDLFRADIWLNWERFIFTGDPFQEEFTAGFSSRIFAGDRAGKVLIEIPLQLLATHKGGQIDDSDERMQTLVNFAAGVHMDLDIGHSFIEKAGFRGYVAGFRDLSSVLLHHYRNGWGIYPNLYVKTKWLQGGIGYWRGNRFVAPRGEPLFQSVSQVDPDLASDHRELLTSKLIFDHNLVSGINMAVRFEVYYDLPDDNFDYGAGLHIMIDERFFITRLQRK